jgi:hypothetical protein
MRGAGVVLLAVVLGGCAAAAPSPLPPCVQWSTQYNTYQRKIGMETIVVREPVKVCLERAEQ